MSEKAACMSCPHPNTAHDPDDSRCLAPGCTCERWSEPMLSYPINDIEDLICGGCKRVLPPGVPVAKHFDAVGEDGMTWFFVTCVYCDMDDIERADRGHAA